MLSDLGQEVPLHGIFTPVKVLLLSQMHHVLDLPDVLGVIGDIPRSGPDMRVAVSSSTLLPAQVS